MNAKLLLYKAVLSVLFLLTCCNRAENVFRVDLHGWCGEIDLESNGELQEAPELAFSSATRQYYYTCDSISEGQLVIRLKNVFGLEEEHYFNVNSDTSFAIRPFVWLNRCDFLSIEELLKAHTIQYVMEINSCFSNSVNRLTLIRNEQGYLCNEFSSELPTVENSFQMSCAEGIEKICELFQLELALNLPRLGLNSDQILVLSTTSTRFSFRADSSVCSIHQPYYYMRNNDVSCYK